MCAGPRRMKKRGPEETISWSVASRSRRYQRQALNELPQPQPPVAFGLLNVKPEPCMEET